MATRQTIDAEVVRLVGTARSERGVAALSEYVDLALRDVNRYSPRVVRAQITGDGTDEYALAAPYEIGFSSVLGVEFYAGGDFNLPPRELLAEEYDAREITSGDAAQIRFRTLVPGTTDKVVVEHTARHTLTDAANTTTVDDDEAAATANRAAAILCRAAAASLSATVPQGLDEDAVSAAFGTAGDSYRRLAEDFDEAFGRLLGVDMTKGATAAKTGKPIFRSVPAHPSVRSDPYLTHPRRRSRWLG